MLLVRVEQLRGREREREGKIFTDFQATWHKCSIVVETPLAFHRISSQWICVRMHICSKMTKTNDCHCSSDFKICSNVYRPEQRILTCCALRFVHYRITVELPTQSQVDSSFIVLPEKKIPKIKMMDANRWAPNERFLMFFLFHFLASNVEIR